MIKDDNIYYKLYQLAKRDKVEELLFSLEQKIVNTIIDLLVDSPDAPTLLLLLHSILEPLGYKYKMSEHTDSAFVDLVLTIEEVLEDAGVEMR